MNVVVPWKRRKMVNFFQNTPADTFLKLSEDKLLPVIREVASRVPAYQRLLKDKNININQVKNKEDFKRLIPVSDKGIFSANEVADLCRDGALNKMKLVSTSSGFSRQFSYGLSSARELNNLRFSLDSLLDLYFNVSKRKTFLINCLAMGVKVYTSLPLAETSVRSDMVIALIKKISSHFEQTIIIGNTYFIKKLIEEGLESGIDWKSKIVNFIIGEDWFPEGLRSYFAKLLGIDFNQPEKGLIMSTMGICELGLTLFQESFETIRLRRMSQADNKLHSALFGEGTDICPILFHYHPYQIFLEEIDGGLVFTTLSKDNLIPFIRYASGDIGGIRNYNDLKDVLMKLNYHDCVPKWKLPLVWVIGRKGQYIELNNIHVSPEQVKSGIYSDFEVAEATTGYFRMSKQNERLRLEIQLREGKNASDQLNGRFFQAITKYVKTDFELLLYPYKEFPYGMGLIYEQKFKYI